MCFVEIGGIMEPAKFRGQLSITCIICSHPPPHTHTTKMIKLWRFLIDITHRGFFFKLIDIYDIYFVMEEFI